ncbi:hypothetical protein [Billgrantia bachuensis]|uniref:Uncharacterized protein n=1 Tax=Billgrantia bachuensis TaxID=2717286 RepID=A0ABX0PNS4_9GAMM|nr:hypothetical protein [Halomonas bachuensis]NIC04925.1 hypothetical protein [Halomonas bachuensis]
MEKKFAVSVCYRAAWLSNEGNAVLELRMADGTAEITKIRSKELTKSLLTESVPHDIWTEQDDNDNDLA